MIRRRFICDSFTWIRGLYRHGSTCSAQTELIARLPDFNFKIPLTKQIIRANLGEVSITIISVNPRKT